MFELQDKVILILSPQSWGTMFISKHHYALELAKRGNLVYFLNPPEQEKKGKSFIDIRQSDLHANLFLISHRLYFPFVLKFHALPVFHRLMKSHIRSILASIGKAVDIVWSFDLNHVYPFKYFPSSMLKIFHPVDEPLNKPAIDAASGANIIFSVTHEIIEKYKGYKIPSYFINHGVADIFLRQPHEEYETRLPARVGISGNMLRSDIDRATLLQIMQSNPAVEFDCWGSYLSHQANIGGSDDAAANQFISGLRKLKNVKLHGAVSADKLAVEIQHADLFLICYDIARDQSRGTNYHKIMEYLATGRVIVSNNVSTYKDMPHLVQMTAERANNNALPHLFENVVQNLAFHNSKALQAGRYEFAKNNTYEKQLDRIEEILEKIRKAAPIHQPV